MTKPAACGSRAGVDGAAEGLGLGALVRCRVQVCWRLRGEVDVLRNRMLGAGAVATALVAAGGVIAVAVLVDRISAASAWLDGGWRKGDVAEWESYDGVGRGTVTSVGPDGLGVRCVDGSWWCLPLSGVRRVVA